MQKSLTIMPSNDTKATFLAFQQQNFTEQHKFLHNKKIEESKKVLNKIDDSKHNIEDCLGTVAVPIANALVQIPTKHYHLTSGDDENYNDTFVPSNELKIRYRVFRDLWERGKFITNAESFGGDFLVYPGEPLYFHASHIVHVVETGQITPTFLVERARLSVMVNKFCVFAYIERDDKIAYQTIDWDGNYESGVIW